jgi:hypothetical protein
VRQAVSIAVPWSSDEALIDGLRDAPDGATNSTRDEVLRLTAALEEALLWLRAQDPEHAARIIAQALDEPSTSAR